MGKQRGSEKRPPSIKRRVVQLVLIPSVALMVVWLGASLYLFGTGFYDREIAVGVKSVSIPAVTGLASVEKERELSMAYLAQPSKGLTSLLTQQQTTDTNLNQMRTAAAAIMGSAPQAVVDKMNVLTGYIDQLPKVRGEIDAGVATQSDVYAFYNNLLDAATDLFDTQARIVPDVNASQGGIVATDVFRASDLMSRSSSLVSGAFAANKLDVTSFLEFANLVGAYHSQLTSVATDLDPSARSSYDKLVASQPWQQLVAAENSIIQRGAWTDGVPTGVEVTPAGWLNLSDQVSNALVGMSVTQATAASSIGLDAGDQQLLYAALGSVLALAVGAIAILYALRQSQLLVDRALITRLASLRDEALALVNEKLPKIVSQLREGRSVDVQAELPELDYGRDEIGQVATAINEAQRTAVAAAAQEAQARSGLHSVFLGIAHRNQRPLHHMLNLLDTLEHQQQDPVQLERLFQLDHQATQARRNIENLVILGGGQLRRRWRNPIAMLDVLRSAISETKQYARIKLQRVPEVTIVGDAVAGVVHLVSELLDNAISFSSPEFPVLVSSRRVDLGVVIEIEDQGLGMSDADRERANQMLAEPPEFDVMALRDGSQLGFWVIAQLAASRNIRVELRQSAYGGVFAIVLVPNRLLTNGEDGVEPVEAPETETQHGELSDVVDDVDLVSSSVAEPTPMETTLEIPRYDARVIAATTALEPGSWPDAGARRQLPDVTAVGTVNEDMPTSSANGYHHVTDVTEDAHWPTQAEAQAQAEARADRDKPGGRPQLPQRQPQQHLTPQLRDNIHELGKSSTNGHADEPDEDGSAAEVIRTKLSAFQRGASEARRATD